MLCIAWSTSGVGADEKSNLLYLFLTCAHATCTCTEIKLLIDWLVDCTCGLLLAFAYHGF